MKTNFIKKAVLLTVVAVTLILSSAFITQKRTNTANKVMIYGIVYANECNAESFKSFEYKLVDADKYWDEEEKLRQSLKSENAFAKNIKVSSSRESYGPDATHMSVIRWSKKNSNNCKYEGVTVAFGESITEANSNAVKRKKMVDDIISDYVYIQKYW